MNPYLSWAIVLVVAGGLGWYYTDGSKPKGRSAVRTTTEKNETALSAPKQKKKARKAPESAPAPARKPEERKPEEKPNWQSAPLDTADEEDVDNKEFAKRFAAVKNGVALSDSSKNRSKEKRAKKAAVAAANQLESGSSERSGSHVSTRTSSTTGADADDDLSSAGSPVVNATVPSADDVSDMLEPPAPGASVLRLTGSMESETKKQKSQKFKQVESKKQRQQRLKNEARKQQVQEAEEQRRKLLEKQLHTARKAERREAARKQPASPANAWKTNKPMSTTSNGAPKVPVNHNVPLLDTFDPEKPATSQPDSSSTGTWAQGLPPEEEQMRILGVTDKEDDWTTVSSKKGKKKGAKADESVSDASASEIQAPAEVVAPKVSPIPIPDTRGKGHPLDSDWAA
ncbi:hypothetical protein VTN96DRAFT_6600 [Rasamsonia emersonii]|uniref:Uncharacterized protein n=1 Tax=Rasamsonia emersonii (strain ATCC 16479 / CBS 393.64 / IMI 116815) TaxID=1408163 RepID=A0A0F4YY58_RASE3|nr:hypothetical protein T310_2767 [Rasamsonia emersonii CBS 393.64]KKA23217.1 hypothetical protein T310_2767 [Rasamsonia emersonii CBS 393.64]